MSKSDSGLFSGIESPKVTTESETVSTTSAATPLFSNTGHVSKRSISANREFFYGKSVTQIDSALKEQGYQTTIRKSKHDSSRAKIIITANSDQHRNITQVQVSPGSQRHGNVPYVKISTNNAGKFKVIDASKSEYKSDGKETATLFFRRKEK
ncbi:MAG: hypothetical protein HDQ95_02915 [Roseburia sp.]|nr:hypothetical protein [Roseburia sp.]